MDVNTAADTTKETLCHSNVNGGLFLKGSAVRKCLDSGAWNGIDAICRGKAAQ